MIDEYGIEQNPFGQLGKCKEQIGKLLMHNKNVTDLVMPELDDEDFSFEQNWYGCKCQKDIYGEQRNITLRGHCKDTPFFDETYTVVPIESVIGEISAKASFSPSFKNH